jgi:hypothetical protein
MYDILIIWILRKISHNLSFCCSQWLIHVFYRFTFKVIIEIKIGKASKKVEISEKSKNIIEVYGAPHQKKKMAADDAAEGALWYLKHIGFGLKNK